MKGYDRLAATAAALERRAARRPRTRRPWALIIAALLLVLLSSVLWIKWRDARKRADELDAELKKVYSEAEALRMEGALAKQRIGQLEQQLRALSGDRGKAAAPPPGPQPGGQQRSGGGRTNNNRTQSP
ncbi:MAG TPA: hypothetical protein VFO18_02315 [Methylomirabilota bacterium]|nr:hypothetical protein [Methylomirabilota bacterium]